MRFVTTLISAFANAGPHGASPKLGGPARLWASIARRTDARFGLGFPESRAYLAAMKKPRDVIQPRWGVYLLKRKAERMPFTVTARTPEEAIERAIKEYDVRPCERFRISVQREA
jgi:hypothetical protein